MNLDFSEVLNKFEPKGVADLLIGVDKNGKLHSHDFSHEKDLLIVGQMGRNVAMHPIVLSGMINKSPRDIQFVFYDPQQVNYLEYKNSPFLMKNIMYHTEELEEYLIELKAILDKRMKQIVDTKTINIERYNKYARENDLEQFPYIITVIDEIAFPSCQNPEIQEHLVRIMQRSWAVGISFIIGTQMPNRNVINGTLKSNIPSRIAMKVAGKTESMITIDEVGAEQLNKPGEMIYKDADGHSEFLQSSYVSKENRKTLCDYFNTKYSI